MPIKILPRRKIRGRTDRYVVVRRGNQVGIWDKVNACMHSFYNGISEAARICVTLNNMQRINEQRYGTPPLWSGEYEYGRYDRQVKSGYRYHWY